MKVTSQQVNGLNMVLQQCGVDKSRLSLVKRHGRINVFVEGLDSRFEFFRRKSISITPGDHQWEKLEHYEVNFGGNKIIVASWDEVIQQFRQWVQSHFKSS